MTHRVLVTNDDGIDSPGLHALARAVADVGWTVVVAAPLEEQSATGAGFGAQFREGVVRVHERQIDGLDAPVYAIDGPPALCVYAARQGALGDPPTMVVSGINPGLNAGRAVLASGTVGATLTGAFMGLAGLAVSQTVAPEGDPQRWDTAATLAASLIDRLDHLPAETVWNLNVPNLSPAEVRGVRWATLAPFGQTRLEHDPDGHPDHLVWRMAPGDRSMPADCDVALVADGYATLTTLTIPSAHPEAGEPPVLPWLARSS